MDYRPVWRLAEYPGVQHIKDSVQVVEIPGNHPWAEIQNVLKRLKVGQIQLEALSAEVELDTLNYVFSTGRICGDRGISGGLVFLAGC